MVLSQTCLLPEQTQNYHYMCLWFWIPWYENRIPFNIFGTISLLHTFFPFAHGSFSLASEIGVRRSPGSCSGRTSPAPLAVESSGPASRQEVSGSGDAAASAWNFVKHLVCKVGFSRKVVGSVGSDLRGSTAALEQVKWF